MSVAHVTSTSGLGSAQNPTFSITVSGTNPAIMVGSGLDSASATISSVSWSLGSGTAVEVKNQRTGPSFATVFAVPAPAAGAGTLTVNKSVGAINHQVAVSVLSDTHQTTPAPTGDAVTDTYAASNVSTALPLTPANLTANDASFMAGVNTTNNNPTGVSPNSVYFDATTSVNLQTGYRLGTGAITANYTDTGATGGNISLVAVRVAQFAAASTSATPAPTPRLIKTDRLVVTGGGLPQSFAPRKVQIYPSPASFDFPVQNVPPLGQATPEVMRLKPFRAAPFLARVAPAAAAGTSTPAFVIAALATHSYLGQVPQVRAQVGPGRVTHTYTAQVPQVRAQVRPGQVTHTYTAQTPQVRASVKPSQVTHTYVGQVPQLRAQVRPAQATHTYTARVPTVSAGTRVLVAQVTHTYTAQVPQVRAQVRPAQATHTYTARTPNVVTGASVLAALATHSYTGRVPQVRAQVRPAQVTHTYTGRVPQVQIAKRVSATLVTHTYTSRVPGFRTSISVPRATHTYTSRVPVVVIAGAPLYGFGARAHIGGTPARDLWKRIGGTPARDLWKSIGGTPAKAKKGQIGGDE
jgi:hypothetical protein